MKKITWMQGAFALIAALMLVLPTRAEVAFATDLFGTYKFTATVDAFVDEAGNDYSAFYKEECEVKITRCSHNIFEGEIQGLAGATAVQSIKSIDLETNTIKISSPNGSNGNGLWGGDLYMANANGDYPFAQDNVYCNIEYTFDPVTKTITLPDFTLVTCDHANSSSTVVALFSSPKLVLTENSNDNLTGGTSHELDSLIAEFEARCSDVEAGIKYLELHKLILESEEVAYEYNSVLESTDKTLIVAVYDGILCLDDLCSRIDSYTDLIQLFMPKIDSLIRTIEYSLQELNTYGLTAIEEEVEEDRESVRWQSCEEMDYAYERLDSINYELTEKLNVCSEFFSLVESCKFHLELYPSETQLSEVLNDISVLLDKRAEITDVSVFETSSITMKTALSNVKKMAVAYLCGATETDEAIYTALVKGGMCVTPLNYDHITLTEEVIAKDFVGKYNLVVLAGNTGSGTNLAKSANLFLGKINVLSTKSFWYKYYGRNGSNPGTADTPSRSLVKTIADHPIFAGIEENEFEVFKDMGVSTGRYLQGNGSFTTEPVQTTLATTNGIDCIGEAWVNGYGYLIIPVNGIQPAGYLTSVGETLFVNAAKYLIKECSIDSVITSTEYLTACENLKALVAECDSLFAVSPVANLAQVLTTAKMFVANIENASLAEVNLVSQNLQKVRDAVVMMDMLVTRSDVKLTVTNDPTYPWKLDEANQCITNSNNIEDYTSSQASFSFKSDKKTEIKMDWACNNHGNHKLELYVDGTLEFITQNSSYNTLRFYLDAGEHVISVRDTLGYTYYNEYEWSRIKNLSIKEIRPLEDSLLTAKSERITFENDGEYPWTWEDGYAQSSNYGHAYSASKFSTTFTIEEPSKFSFDVCVNSYYYDGVYHNLVVNINKEKYGNYSTSFWWDSSTGWIQKSVLLEPGKYTIEFLDSVNTSNTTNLSRLRNVELHSDWLEIDLASAGTLGAEVLYQVDVLGDVELLRVKGTLNAEDWAIIKQMKNLVGLDLTGARFDAVPDYGFDGLTYLSSVKLPEGMTSIGVYAFRGTQIWKIQIPATVTSIGERAFWETRLEEITFSEDSQLKIIGGAAFAYCASLKEFVMPNTVTTLKGQTMANGSSVFYCCSSLKKLHFSDALTHIPEYTCYECYRLSDVHWPKGLVSIGYRAFRDVDDLCSLEFPETLTSIGSECFWSNNSLTHVVLPAKLTSLGDDAFIHCDGLKYIEFPSYIERYYYTLRNCTALDTIVCHAPTPPTVAGDILSGGRAKSDVTLIVPAFSAVSYKLDSYWYQYGNIVASEEVQDYWRVAGDLALTNNRRMGGKPDIDLYYNGRMLVGGDAAFEAGTMNFFISESQPCRLLNNCPTMNVDSVNTYYSVNANTWYFFTPLYDVKVSDVTMSNDASYVIRYYDGAVRASAGTGSSWTDVPKDSVLLAGQGYIFRCNKACVVNIPADRSVHAQLFDFAAKEIALETHETETEANRNWNYVGNPYPCYYDIWYMDFTAPITVWTGSTYAAYSVTDDDFVLRPMQSFFVQKPDGVDSIRFRTEGRQLTNTVAHASYAARSTAPRFVFNLEIGTDSVADRTRVVFNATRSMDYELACDASKFMSMDATVPQIYSLDDKGNRLAINERPKADGRVALGVYVAQAGEYTLSASRMDGKATLYDALTDSYTDLSETSYTFRAEGTGYIEDRFELMLEVPGGATGIDETEADTTVKVTVKEGFIRVSGAEGTVVQLYSIDGKQLQSQTISGGNALFVVPADGVYVVTANGVSQKAVVQEGWR